MIEKLTNAQIEEVLKDNVWGHLGCNDGFNTYVYPLIICTTANILPASHNKVLKYR